MPRGEQDKARSRYGGRARRDIHQGMTADAHRDPGNARAVVASIDGDVIRLRRCAKVFIALGLSDYAVVEPPELETVYSDNVMPFAPGSD